MASDLSCSFHSHYLGDAVVDPCWGAADFRGPTYTCKTDFPETNTSNGLAFNVVRAGNIVGRWAKNSTISYFVSTARLVQTQIEAVKVAMSVAANNWALPGLSITFIEAPTEDDALLLVVYDRFLDANTFARAFFPGDSRRVIDIGPRLLSSAQHMSNILTHELGHVLGLRHELWDFNIPMENNSLVHWPTITRDLNSIMNNHNACNLPLLVLSERDRQIICEFYNLPAGKQRDFYIEDYIPTPVLGGFEGWEPLPKLA